MLTPISWGENPHSLPYASDVFLPDQLIAGRAPISAQGLLASGSAVVYRGTVLGKVGFGTQVTAIGKATATQTIVVAALPTATTVGEAVTSFDTLTLNGTVIAFQTPQYDQQPQQGTGTSAAPYIVFIGPPTFPSTGAPGSTTVTTAMVAQALQAFLNGPVAQADAQLSKLAPTTLSASTLTLTYYLPGTAGNGFTLATSNSSAFTLGNTTLLSGAANTGTGVATVNSLGVQAKSGLYTAVGTSSTALQRLRPARLHDRARDARHRLHQPRDQLHMGIGRLAGRWRYARHFREHVDRRHVEGEPAIGHRWQ